MKGSFLFNRRRRGEALLTEKGEISSSVFFDEKKSAFNLTMWLLHSFFNRRGEEFYRVSFLNKRRIGKMRTVHTCNEACFGS